jgi:hypothetical protein
MHRIYLYLFIFIFPCYALLNRVNYPLGGGGVIKCVRIELILNTCKPWDNVFSFSNKAILLWVRIHWVRRSAKARSWEGLKGVVLDIDLMASRPTGNADEQEHPHVVACALRCCVDGQPSLLSSRSAVVSLVCHEHNVRGMCQQGWRSKQMYCT